MNPKAFASSPCQRVEMASDVIGYNSDYPNISFAGYVSNLTSVPVFHAQSDGQSVATLPASSGNSFTNTNPTQSRVNQSDASLHDLVR